MVTFGFLIFIIVERNSLYNSLYMLTERSLKHPYSTRGLGPGVFSLSLCLSLPPSLFLPSANSLEHGSLPSSLSFPQLSRPPQEGTLCLSEWCKPCSRVLLVLCVNQGISASFSFTFLSSTADHQVPVH